MIPIGNKPPGGLAIHFALVRQNTEAAKMVTRGREVMLMVKIAGSFASLLLVSGLALPQTDAQKSSASNVQSWQGTLVDANCAGVSGSQESRAAKENNGENKGAA